MSGRPAKRRAALAVAALSLGALATVRAGGGGPPLYDGICLPPHYLVLGGNPPAPSQSKTFSAADIASTFEVADNDSTPQAQIIVGPGSLAAPPGAATATVSITPTKPPAIAPASGTIDGNAYSFEVQSGGHPLALATGHPATVVLEATSSGSQPTVEHFDGAHWTALKTFTAGCGTTFEAASPALGIFALVVQGSTGSPASPSSGGPPVALLVVAVVVVALALAIGGTRLSRRRR
ncbi:MAG TPA: hypothetical protein VH661_05720 [Candidatus Dormibacteraeota bacterium]|jgi:hypothetical protein|nr:hypothetical protein [Candidatus Dormibacteraeota bacterium]